MEAFAGLFQEARCRILAAKAERQTDRERDCDDDAGEQGLDERGCHLELRESGKDGEVSAAILFAAGRYNAFNFMLQNGSAQDQEKAVEFYVAEYRKAIVSNLEGVVGPLVKPHG